MTADAPVPFSGDGGHDRQAALALILVPVRRSGTALVDDLDPHAVAWAQDRPHGERLPRLAVLARLDHPRRQRR